MLPPMAPLSTLTASSPEDLEHQARLRRSLLSSMLDQLHTAPTLDAALAALRAQAASLAELGLHDEAARLAALSRAVLGDVTRITAEARQLEDRIALRSQAKPQLSTATASK